MTNRHKTKPENLLELVGRLEELILANSGADVFDVIYKLFVAKIWSEIGSNENSFGAGDSNFAISSSVRKLLREANDSWAGILGSQPNIDLDDDHLSECVAPVCLFQLSEQGAEVIDALFEGIESRSSKGSKGQYFTPRYVVDFCVRMIAPKAGEFVADPACGSGAFLWHTASYLGDQNVDGSKLFGFDFDEKALGVSKLLSMLHTGDPHRTFRVNSLAIPLTRPDMFKDLQNETENPGSGQLKTTVEDICRVNRVPEGMFDVIMTNPPFAGEIVDDATLSSYKLSAGKKRVERDVLFVERCIDLLKPGGRLAMVLPFNKLGGKNYAHVREHIVSRLDLTAVVSLGRNTFQPHTGQKACVIFGVKRRKPRIDINRKIFMAINVLDAKDSKGRYRGGESGPEVATWQDAVHDFDSILHEYHSHSEKSPST